MAKYTIEVMNDTTLEYPERLEELAETYSGKLVSLSGSCLILVIELTQLTPDDKHQIIVINNKRLAVYTGSNKEELSKVHVQPADEIISIYFS